MVGRPTNEASVEVVALLAIADAHLDRDRGEKIVRHCYLPRRLTDLALSCVAQAADGR
jgi:hypothetical protein